MARAVNDIGKPTSGDFKRITGKVLQKL